MGVLPTHDDGFTKKYTNNTFIPKFDASMAHYALTGEQVGIDLNTVDGAKFIGLVWGHGTLEVAKGAANATVNGAESLVNILSRGQPADFSGAQFELEDVLAVKGGELTSLFVDPFAGNKFLRVFVKGGKVLNTAGDTARASISHLPPLRQEYVKEVWRLENTANAMLKDGANPEAVARTVSEARRSLGVKYKDLTPQKELSEIYTRNLETYGDKLGPTVDYLRKKGKSWEEIIKSSSRVGGKDIGY